MTTKAPEISCILRIVKVSIEDSKGKIYTFDKEEMFNFELKSERHNPSIYGSLIVNDMTDINSQIDIKTSNIVLYCEDMLGGFFYRTFKIINVIEIYNDKNSKCYDFKLRDIISYKLDNIYISKSFYGSRADALEFLMSTYDINKYITIDKIKKNIKYDNVKENFILTKNKSALKYLLEDCERVGMSFFQTRNSFEMVNKDSLLPDKLPIINEPFLQSCQNQIYKHKIYELVNKPTQIEQLDTIPTLNSYYFDYKTKTMKKIEKNISDYRSYITMNNDIENIQSVQGIKTNYQNRFDENSQKHSILENFLKSSQIEIIINGYVKNNINQIIDVELLGHKSNRESQSKGNFKNSGKFIVLSITDKIVGDKMLQKLQCGRSDSNKGV